MYFYFLLDIFEATSKGVIWFIRGESDQQWVSQKLIQVKFTF